MSLTSEKEIFLREQITSVYYFIAKTVIALASSALAFSIGLQGFLDGHGKVYLFLLPMGWASLLLSIALVIIFSIYGLSLLYRFFNNLQESGVEINEETQAKEKKLGFCLLGAFCFFILGVILILSFVYINMLVGCPPARA